MIIKTEKYDNLLDNILLYTFLGHIVFQHIYESQVYFLFGVSALHTFFVYLSLIYLALKLLYDLLRGRIGLKVIIAYLLCALLFFIINKSSKENMLDYYIILSYIVAFTYIDKEKWIKYVFIATFVTFLLIVLLSFIGVTTNYMKVEADRTRYYLGYDWNNVAHNHFMALLLLYNLYKKELKIYDYVVIALINIIMFIFTTTKTAFLCVFVFIIINILYSIPKISEKVYKIFGYIASASVVLLPLSFSLLSFFYDGRNPIFKTLNSFTTGRIGLTHDAFMRWGTTLFGKVTKMNMGENYNYVDNSFLQILFTKGYILLILILLVYFVFIYISIKKKNKVLTLVLFITLLHSTIEPWLMSLTNFPLIVLFLAYLKDNKMELK